MRARTFFSSFCFSLLFLSACGGRAVVARSSHDELRVVVRGDQLEAYTADELFTAAGTHAASGDCDAASLRYERLAREFPDSSYASPSLYNAALCFQRRAGDETLHTEAKVPDVLRAVHFYEQLLERFADGSDSKHATFQLCNLLLRANEATRALTFAERLLTREDLDAAERFEALARRAQALLGQSRAVIESANAAEERVHARDEAKRQASEALAYFRTRPEADSATLDPFFAGAANFVFAETQRMESESIAIPTGTPLEQHAALERRAQLLLDAQRSYFDTIRQTHAFWASAAGYQIGTMYRTLHVAIGHAPIPPPSREMSVEARQVYDTEYVATLRRRIQPLMRHAIRYWELTLQMIERTGVRGEWVDRIQHDLVDTRSHLLDEVRS